MRRFIKSEELAAQLGVNVETIRTWARRGWIPVARAGRRPLLFDPDEVDEALWARGSGRPVRDRSAGSGS